MRTHSKHARVFTNGVDVSGYSRSVGSLDWTFDAEPDSAYTDGVKNILIGKGDIVAGTYSAFLDNDAAGLFNLAGLASADHGTMNFMVALGANAAPVAGDNVFAWKFEQTSYQVEPGSGFVAVTLPFGGASYASPLNYKKPWGKLLHANALETDVNSAAGIDDNGASSALGGIFVYHLHSSDGTVTLTAQDASTNTDINFANITGATSGSIDASVTPQSGMIAISTTAAVKRYLRWQIAFGTATGVSFTCAFIRNNTNT
jgi:hypothetical protein